jgi:bacterioferritin-associated ferredoxin
LKLKFNFNIIGFAMAATTLPFCIPAEPSAAPRSRAMTRCECAGVTFQEVAARVRDGAGAEEALRRTGCGQTCTACLPDLARFLASR